MVCGKESEPKKNKTFHNSLKDKINFDFLTFLNFEGKTSTFISSYRQEQQKFRE